MRSDHVALVYTFNQGTSMADTSHAAAKVITDLTCWKCGEESLQAASTDSTSTSHAGIAGVIGNQHSTCTKCGATSVNAAQAKHNKTVNRKSRRAGIREANRKLS
jgi:predicted nucleic-acid-binding Zn-ribbon protein